jgi:GT2 family glycosyltransferase
MTRVDVVIPSYDGRELLPALLPRLFAQTHTDFHAILVDNGSTDGTAEWMAVHWPQVEVLSLMPNRGFAGGVNAGIAHGSNPYVALLSNDMEPEPEWLAELVAALDADPRAGAAAPKQRMGHDRAKLDGAGDIIAWTGGATRRGYGELDEGQYDAPGRIFSACGGAALYRREALEQVGPFDESFHAYLEDVDWSFRAQLHGWHAVYVPTALTYHLGGATTGRIPGHELYLIARNYVALVLKNYPASWLVRFGPWIAAELARTLYVARIDGHLKIVGRAWKDALLRLPSTLKGRRTVQARRAVPLPALEESVFGARRTWRDLYAVRPKSETFFAPRR